MMRITLIGSGNIASWFAFASHKAGFVIHQIYSHNYNHAAALADRYHAEPVDNISSLQEGSDLYLFAVKDDAYSLIIKQLPFMPPLAAHTAGSVSQHLFQGYAESYGVLYPFQTISKTISFDGLEVPLCVEGNTTETQSLLLDIAGQLSHNVHIINEQQRAMLHLAAVFASNFTNAMYSFGYEILRQSNIDRKIILPLLQNTLDKVSSFSPKEVQTGPAIRHDCQTVEKQLQLLTNEEQKKVYRLMTDIIGKF